MPLYPVDTYQIGIICALPKELKAVKAILDDEHEPLKSKDFTDHNSYVLGRVGEHNVVAAGLPVGVYGTTSAALVSRDMLRTFPQLRFGLFVGIGGGVPHKTRDIRLGDIVVSQPDATHGGLVQYDFGKLLGNGEFIMKGTLNKPPQALLTALANLQASLKESSVPYYLTKVDQKWPALREQGYCYQGADQDNLHCTSCDTSQWWWWLIWVLLGWLWPLSLWQCRVCVDGKVVRPHRPYTAPKVHYGVIASGNTLLKNADKRDQLAKDLGVLCVDTEAAGLDDYPCVVIRGICDYSDTYKNDVWQEYAALTAAAFAKELLSYISPQVTREEKPIQQALDQFNQHLQRQHQHNIEIQGYNKRKEIQYEDEQYRNCHRVFDTVNYERQKEIHPDAVPGTCRWVLDNPRYQEWYHSEKNDLLWISADPGCGKSVLSKSLVDEWLPLMASNEPTETAITSCTVCYFFFGENEDQCSLATALCAVLHQLFTHQPSLIRHALASYHKHKPETLTKNINELWRILQSAVDDPNAQPVIFVLDALDECRGPDCRLLVDLLCRSHRDNHLKHTTRGFHKWILTSRPHDDLQGYFGRFMINVPSIRLRGEDENDQIAKEINLVIDQRMGELSRQLRLTDAKREEVVQRLRKTTSRTYLWLHLVFEDIEVTFKRSARTNQVKVSSLPETVYQAYEKMLQRIVDREEQHYAKTALKIIVGARRPLSVAEMARAFDVATLNKVPLSLTDLVVDASNLGNKIRAWCGLFVFINHGRFYLIHQTAKEFLLSLHDESTLDPNGWKHCFRPSEIEQAMAKICVLFLCLTDFNAPRAHARQLPNDDGKSSASDVLRATRYRDSGDNETDWKTGFDAFSLYDDIAAAEPFFVFAAEYWADYVHLVEDDLDDHVHSCIKALYEPESERCRRWTMVVDRPGLVELRRRSDVHIASFYGHCVALQHILKVSPGKVNQVCVRFHSGNITPMSVAAREGHVKVVKLLLAQPDIDVNRGGPIFEAAKNKHLEVVKLLLAHPGIDRNIGWLLSTAAENRHLELVKLLLAQPRVNVNYGKPLSKAAWYGHLEVMKLLLAQPGVDVNNDAPLSQAAYRGHPEVVEALIAHPNINVNLNEPLYMAASEGYPEVVELLLTHPDIDVNLGEPLSHAAEGGHLEVVKLLLAQPKVDVNRGRPLYYANKFGRQEVVELLLAHPNTVKDDTEEWLTSSKPAEISTTASEA